ncbi:MAG: LEA type 2 family protein [Sphingobacteriales bacterium]|nr:LEA type 2 family protein [Sphingobacteriales bacterium]
MFILLIAVMKNYSLLILSCFLAILFLTSCQSVKDPELKGIGNIRMGKSNTGNADLSIDLYYYNPNNYRLRLKRAEGDAWLNDRQLGHFIIDSMVRIDALSDFILPAKVTIDKEQLSKNAAALLLNREVTVKVEGVARVGKGPVYINYPIRYETRQSLKDLIK